MVGVGVCFEEILDRVALRGDETEQGIGGVGTDREGRRIKVENGVDDGRMLGVGTGKDILPCTCAAVVGCVKDRLHDGSQPVTELFGL